MAEDKKGVKPEIPLDVLQSIKQAEETPAPAQATQPKPEKAKPKKA